MATGSDPFRYKASHDQFWEQHLKLGSSLFSFLDPDSSAHCAVCARCV